MDTLIISHRNNCRGCFSKNLKCFLDLGTMPLAGGFLKKNQIVNEVKIPLKVYFCKNCGLVQILDVVDPTVLFKNYFYISSVIKSLSDHFKEYSQFLKRNYLKKNGSQLLEFGSNDGVLLQYFMNNKNIKTLGIDPSVNVSKIARKKGLNVIVDYFSQKSALKINQKYGLMDVVTGSNVFAHVDDIHEIINAAKILLKENGVFIVEVHYLLDLRKKFQYDTIYHEHLCYYSVYALKNIFELEDLKIVDVQRLSMHGGGIRVIATKKSSRLKVSENVKKIINNELKNGLNKFTSFKKFASKIVSHKEKLQKLLLKIKKQKKTIVGYGASGRGTTLLNYCNIDTKILDYIVDLSPLRAGMLMPGVHIPIFHPEKSRKNPPDYFLVLAWNYFDSILQQEKKLKSKGVKFIIPFPKIKVI